jgi:hypothetical protein
MRASPKYTADESTQRRQSVLAQMETVAAEFFERYPALNSIGFCVSQFWNDEADDAVHFDPCFSELRNPDFEAGFREDVMYEGLGDLVNLPSMHSEFDRFSVDMEWADALSLSDPNGENISLFAAFCKEGCDQEMPTSEVTSPYAVFRRGTTNMTNMTNGATVETEIVGVMLRPWLDGVRPDWEAKRTSESHEVTFASWSTSVPASDEPSAPNAFTKLQKLLRRRP